jgi:undecaprenyl-diphosphatase
MKAKKYQRWLAVDALWTERIGTITQNKFMRWVATVLAHSGDSLIWLVAGAIMWRFGLGLWARLGERIVIVIALTWLCTILLKLFFQRPRPDGDQKLFYLNIDANSFPSGHATRAGGLVVVLAPLLSGWGVFALVVWALSVCISRIALGLHYVSDMVGGLLVGAIAGLLLISW